MWTKLNVVTENTEKAKKRQHTATAYLTTTCYLLVKRRARILF